MNHLLNKQLQRMIKIIEMLIFSDHWLTQGTIAQSLNSSERTVAEDISLIKRQYSDLLDLQFSNKLGVRARNRNVAILADVLADIYRSSFILQWIELVFLFPSNSTIFYAKRLNVSESTLYKLYPSLKEKLRRSGIEFKRIFGNYSFTAENEAYIRTFFTTFFIEMYGLNILATSKHLSASKLYQKNIVDMFDQSIFVVNFELDVIHRQFHLMYFFVSFYRANQGFSLTELPVNSYSQIIDYPLIRHYYGNITISQLNEIFTCYYEYILRPPLDLIKHDPHFEKVKESFQSFMNDIHIDSNEAMVDDFIRIFYEVTQVFRLLPYRIASLYTRIDYFCVVFKQYHFSVYLALEKILKALSEDFKINYPDIIESILFWMCIEHPNFFVHAKSKAILVVSDLGQKHAEFIRQILNSYYDNPKLINVKTNAYVYKSRDISALAQNFDLIVSTTHDIIVGQTPIFCISDYPNDETLFKIYKFLINDSPTERYV